ncbi:DNA-3-methyladenine glycosylase 2 family protein [Brevibacterium jeotgali]|uniref:DNA-3-methyladenine glycosylase II n=1 Tax=Brevibacterium jeotgali TaxID=1262550 RepID=A0A2H1L7S5_9MICO|nr:Ada metal-binding domain-containing protein [Brevibacterium jeotgali]TWC03141.1 DNA-3-methyladenine glycosylase II [Brevibacterium jeotgali]SMY12800.1 DNA-3-methyladenine glycosylase II [Brevibacterium jeotgali]
MQTPRTHTAVCAEGDPGFPERYRAISARDARFDGQFLTGVKTTGIYCRPSCPALTPKPQNVVFLLTAAAAHEEGFRACRRCLPDAVPGTPAWNLRQDVAARAMRLIEDGAVDRAGVPELARTLGFTPRHLTRLVTAELGAGPLSLARAHRAQTARTLATETDLSFADVAFAAGFSSVRQFNETVRDVFAATPSELRARRRHRAPPTTGTAAGTGPANGPGAGTTTTASADIRLAVDLPVRPPFDATGMFAFLSARAISGVETADLTDPGRLRYARTLALPHGSAVAEVVATAQPPAPGPRPGNGSGTARHPCVDWSIRAHLTLTSLADAPTAIARLRRMLDLDADPHAADAVLSADPLLEPLIAAAPGARLPGAVDAHELAVRAVIGQQISVAAAGTHLGRLVAHAGTPVQTSLPGLTALFPTPERIAEAVVPVPAGTRLDPGRPLRLPRRSLTAIHDLATDLAEGSLDLHLGMDPSDMRAALVSRRGLGPWTAAYITMRVLGDPDVWLPGDAALLTAARALGCKDDLEARSAQWAPWRSYAVIRLWRANADRPPTLPQTKIRPQSPQLQTRKDVP